MWDPSATVLVDSRAVQGPPDVRYFAGSLARAPGSTVMLSVDAAGGVSGMATHGKERWELGRPALSPQAAAAGVAPAGLSSRKAARNGATAPNRPHFHCGASGLEAERPPQAQRPQQAQQAGGQGSAARKLLQVSYKTLQFLPEACTSPASYIWERRNWQTMSLSAPILPTQTSPRIASLALETDGELYKRLGGATALKNYVGQLIACECCGCWGLSSIVPHCRLRWCQQFALACQLLPSGASPPPCNTQWTFRCVLAAADANTIFTKEIGVQLRITWCVAI